MSGGESRQFATFYLDEFFFGIGVEKVQEVLRFQSMTRVPLAPSLISGLINLRGQIVTAIDLRGRLDLPPRPAHILPMNVVIRNKEEPLSLLVDKIGGVMRVEEAVFERPPETLVGVARELIQGTYKLRDRLLLILDLDKAIELNSFS